ncbi:hypothetical protein DFH09DRAFT_1078442 [Mycena vulgaris]|nr:hypothetical protein DFH09DRAFT_1078442 [Mycena vulgaris]
MTSTLNTSARERREVEATRRGRQPAALDVDSAPRAPGRHRRTRTGLQPACPLARPTRRHLPAPRLPEDVVAARHRRAPGDDHANLRPGRDAPRRTPRAALDATSTSALDLDHAVVLRALKNDGARRDASPHSEARSPAPKTHKKPQEQSSIAPTLEETKKQSRRNHARNCSEHQLVDAEDDARHPSGPDRRLFEHVAQGEARTGEGGSEGREGGSEGREGGRERKGREGGTGGREGAEGTGGSGRDGREEGERGRRNKTQRVFHPLVVNARGCGAKNGWPAAPEEGIACGAHLLAARCSLRIASPPANANIAGKTPAHLEIPNIRTPRLAKREIEPPEEPPEADDGDGHHAQPDHAECILAAEEARVEEADAGDHDPDEGHRGEDLLSRERMKRERRRRHTQAMSPRL